MLPWLVEKRGRGVKEEDGPIEARELGVRAQEWFFCFFIQESYMVFHFNLRNC